MLQGARAKGHLPHALLFQGPLNSGQWETALELVKALFCDQPTAAGGCGTCAQCRPAISRSHPDLMVLEADKGVIKIEPVRAMITRAGFSPLQARVKVFVIVQAEAMNETAQNALLKTLEEPPGQTHIILISSSPQNLLSTIRSRCQTLHFQPSPPDIGADTELEELKKEAVAFVMRKDKASVTDAPDLGGLERESVAAVMDELIAYTRGLFLAKAGAGEVLAGLASGPDLELAAGDYTLDELQERIEIISKTKERILRKVNARLALSCLWSSL